MFNMNARQELRLCRFAEFEYELVIATLRDDGSVESVQKTGLSVAGADRQTMDNALEDLMMAFSKPAIASKWV